MKKQILLLATLLLTLSVTAQENPMEQFQQFAEVHNYIEVTGRSEVTVKPDQFFMAIVIDESDSKGKYSVKEQQDNMIKGLKKLGVDCDKNLKLKNLNSDYYKRQKSYTSVQYQLQATSEEQLAQVYELLDRLAISNAKLEKVSCSNLDSYRAQARVDAIKNAQKAAQELAEAVGQEIGACCQIDDMSNDYTPNNFITRPIMYRSAANSDAAPESMSMGQTPDFQEIKFDYRVEARFIIKW